MRPQSNQARLRGWLLAELAGLCGLTPRAVRYYVDCGVLPAPVFRGRATRYQRVHLVRLVALPHWRATEELPLSDVRKRLDAVTPQQLESAVWSLPLRDELLMLLHQRDPQGRSAPPPELVAAKPLPDPDATQAAPTPEAPLQGGSLCCRVPLLPGLELLLDSTASPVVRQLAREIQEHVARKLSQ